MHNVLRFVTESVRWLLAKEKNDKAKGIVCKVAEVNNVKLSALLMDSFKEETTVEDSQNNHDILPTLKLIVKSKTLVLRYLIVFYIW